MTHISLRPRIALVAALLAGALALTADAAPAGSTVPVKNDTLVVNGDVGNAPSSDGSTLGITLSHEGFEVRLERSSAAPTG